MNTFNVAKLFIDRNASIHEAIECLNRGAKGIALVVDEERRLLGTITDGDIRRALIAEASINNPISVLLEKKPTSLYPVPVTAHINAGAEEILELMKKYIIHQIPLLDNSNRVVNLVTWEDLLPAAPLPLQAVVLVGGRASRLKPFSDDLPRPMLPVGNRPLLEHTIQRLSETGIHQINLTTHYKPEIIKNHFGDGKQFGVEINYLTERKAAGPAAAFNTLEITNEPILVIKGDVLTNINYRALFTFHQEQKADVTVAVRHHEFQIPHSIVETGEGLVKEIHKKYAIKRNINAGIYLINPDILGYFSPDDSYEISDQINDLVSDGRKVVSFPVHEYWLDIQEYEDYQQALFDAQQGLFDDLSKTVLELEPGTPTPPGFIPLCIPEIRGNEWAYIKDCLDTNWVSSVGAYVNQFENQVASFVGAKYGIATTNGTAALHTALIVAGVQKDDEVLVSALTFIAPANTIRYAGAWPVFIDAEPKYWQMDPQSLSEFLEYECEWVGDDLCNKTTGRRVRAILPVHILGHPCEMDAILKIARKFKLIVIEDATESLGASYKDRMVGNLSDIACFSFNGNKILTTGGGGMIVTENKGWAQKAKFLTTQAKHDPLEYIHKEIGYNYRLTNIQAAMGCAQMEQLEEFVEAKRKIASKYTTALSQLPGITVMGEAAWARSTFWLFTALIEVQEYGIDRRTLLNKLNQAGIQTRPLWQPLNRSPAFNAIPIRECPVAEEINEKALSLPCSVGLSAHEQDSVIEHLQQYQRLR